MQMICTYIMYVESYTFLKNLTPSINRACLTTLSDECLIFLERSKHFTLQSE